MICRLGWGATATASVRHDLATAYHVSKLSDLGEKGIGYFSKTLQLAEIVLAPQTDRALLADAAAWWGG